MREIDIDIVGGIKVPDWNHRVVFTLDHGIILGKKVETLHNALWCISVMFVDGNPVCKWQVINATNDCVLLKSRSGSVELKYRYFASIVVSVHSEGSLLYDMKYPDQTKKLYRIGAVLNGAIIGIVMILVLLTVLLK